MLNIISRPKLLKYFITTKKQEQKFQKFIFYHIFKYIFFILSPIPNQFAPLNTKQATQSTLHPKHTNPPRFLSKKQTFLNTKTNNKQSAFNKN